MVSSNGTAPSTVAPFSLRSIMAPMVAIIVGAFMVVLDGTAVNVAIPRLATDFNSTLSTLQWTITGYTLAQAAVIPLAGWLSDRFGAKRVFLTSVVIFTLGSVLCATAHDSNVLIAFRVLQGLGGGFVLPVAMAFAYGLAPPEKAGLVMSILGIPILFAPALGPVVAAWLVDSASWRWIFLLNLPIGILGVLEGLRNLPDLERQQTPVLDLPGTLLAPLAFSSLIYGVSEGATSWTSANTIGGIVVGAVALVAFVTVELRTEYPLLELHVFQAIDFDLAIIAQWILQFALIGALFMVPQFLESVRGYGALDTGLSLLPLALGAALVLPFGGTLFDRIGARPLMLSGGILLIIACFLLARVGIQTSGFDLILPFSIYGMGVGLSIMPLNTQLINAAPRALVGRVAALNNALVAVVSALAVALLTTFLTTRSSYSGAVHLIAQAQMQAAKAGHVAAASQSALPAPIAAMFSHAFDDTFALIAFVALVATVLGLGLRRRTSAQRDAEATGETAAEMQMPALVG